MKRTLILAGFIISTLFAAAQAPMMGNAKQQAPAMGHIYGKIEDTLGKPIGDVSVILLQNKFDTVTKKRKEVLLKGISTKSNGEFSFSDLPMFGELKLKISATGYEAFEQKVSFQMKMNPAAGGKQDPSQALSNMVNAFDKDLGNIKLSTDIKQLPSISTCTEGTFFITSTAVPPALTMFLSTLNTFLSISSLISGLLAVTVTD